MNSTAVTAKRFRIWTLWTDLSDDTGLVVTASDADAALATAARMGTFSGLGAQWPRYQGAHAQEVK